MLFMISTKNIKQKTHIFPMLIIIRTVFMHQISTLKLFLIDHVTLMTAIMTAEHSASHLRNKLDFKI